MENGKIGNQNVIVSLVSQTYKDYRSCVVSTFSNGVPDTELWVLMLLNSIERREFQSYRPCIMV